MVETILFWIGITILFMLIVWCGLKIQIGDKFCFELYPLKRFFRKNWGTKRYICKRCKNKLSSKMYDLLNKNKEEFINE